MMKKATAGGMGMRGAPAKDVDAYIAAVPEPARGMLEKLRKIIKAAAPKAVEVISYHIPLYKHHGHLTASAAFKNHVGFYVMSKALMAEYKKEFAPYEKGHRHRPLPDRQADPHGAGPEDRQGPHRRERGPRKSLTRARRGGVAVGGRHEKE